jgi:hypothetical protein
MARSAPCGYRPYFEQVAEYVPMERETGLEPTWGTVWGGKRILPHGGVATKTVVRDWRLSTN